MNVLPVCPSTPVGTILWKNESDCTQYSRNWPARGNSTTAALLVAARAAPAGTARLPKALKEAAPTAVPLKRLRRESPPLSGVGAGVDAACSESPGVGDECGFCWVMYGF